MRPFGFPVVTRAPDGGGNTAPQLAAALSAGTDEDAAALTVDLLDGATDADNDPLAVSGFAQTAGRTATVTRTGAALTLDPAQFNDLAGGQTETLTFGYDVTDGTDSAAQTLTITVTGVNDAPTVAAPLTASTDEDAAPLSIDLLSGATDADTGDTPSVTAFAQTGGRAAVITRSGGTLTLDPAQFGDLAAGQTETLTFTYDVTDGTATTAQTLTVTVTGANDAPSVAAALTAGASEDAAPLSIDLLDGATDPDAGAVLSVAGLTQTGGRTATVTQSNGTLTLDPAQFGDLAAGQTETLTFTYGITDGTATAAQALTVTVTGANDAPALTVPGAQTVAEDTDLTLSGLSIADVDAGNAPLRLTLSVGHGMVTLGSTAGLTVTAGANGTGTLTVEGALADLNAALATARYRGALNYNGSDTLQVTVDDLGNGTPGAALTDGESVAITVTAVNDAPTLSAPATLTATAGIEAALTGLTVGDVDAGGAPLRLTLSAGHGELILANTGGLTFVDGTSNGGGTVTVEGSKTALQAALNGVTYCSTGSYTGADQITMSVTDNGNAGSGGALTAQTTVAVTISGAAATDTISGTPNPDVLHGAALNDIIYGLRSNDVLYGDAGQDVLFGQAGDDVISGGTGNDVLYGNGDYYYTKALDYYHNYNWTSQNLYPRQMGDINGDGRDDIVGFGTNYVVSALGQANGTFVNVGGNLTIFVTAAGWSSFNSFPRLIGDYNGDGKDDIYAFASNAVYVAISNGNGTFSSLGPVYNQFTSVYGGWTSQNTFPRLVGDVNNDGYDDILGFGSAGVAVALNQNGAGFAAPTMGSYEFGTNAGWSSNNTYPRQLGDIDGDGNLDIVGFYSNGVYVARGNGDGTFQSAQLRVTHFCTNSTWVSQEVYPRLVGDIDGDGADDIVGFAHHWVQVAYGVKGGNGALSNVVSIGNAYNQDSSWNSYDNAVRLLGDVNGDGSKDIVGMVDTGTYDWLMGDHDTLRGGTGNDTLDGQLGNDVLDGGPGADTLTGGVGKDAFRVTNPSDGGDTVTDFTAGQDRIEVVGPNFGNIPAGTLSASHFALNNPADGNDWFVFNTATGVLSFDADGSGAGAAVTLATLNVTALSHTDILVVTG